MFGVDPDPEVEVDADADAEAVSEGVEPAFDDPEISLNSSFRFFLTGFVEELDCCFLF